MNTAGGSRLQFLAVHPVLMVSDIRDSIRFYVQLGFATAFLDDPGNPRYAGLRRDHVELHLQWHERADGSGVQDRPVYRFLVQDVDALYRDLRARADGVLASAQTTPWHAPADTPWGTREFHVRDPGGNGLHFYQLQSPPDSSGA